MEPTVQQLSEQIEGCKLLTVGIALCLARTQALSLEEFAETLDVMALCARHTISEGAEQPIRHVIEMILASKTQAGEPPERALLLQAMLHADAGPARQKPLSTWLSQATPDEIADELLRLLRLRRGDGDGPPSSE